MLFTHLSLVPHIDGSLQDGRNSSALAMGLRLSCTNPSIYAPVNWVCIASGNDCRLFDANMVKCMFASLGLDKLLCEQDILRKMPKVSFEILHKISYSVTMKMLMEIWDTYI